jgi:hypothetical protein
MAAKWVRVGTVCKKKSGTGTYFKIDNDVTLKKGQYLNIQDPRARRGITQEDMDKIPDFVVREFYLAPTKEEEAADKKD